MLVVFMLCSSLLTIVVVVDVLLGYIIDECRKLQLPLTPYSKNGL